MTSTYAWTWYVDFADPAFPAEDHGPTLFEWVGGAPALRAVTGTLYERHLPDDPLLAPRLAAVPTDSAERLAAWLGESFGGPAAATVDIVREPSGPDVTEEQRARWVRLVLRSADEVRLPPDAPFRAALAGILEWLSRSAVTASDDPAAGSALAPPAWSWTAGAPPAGSSEAEEVDDPVMLPADDELVSFATHIRSMFRAKDRRSMSFAFDLGGHDDVATHAADILARLADGTMPCDRAWPPGWVAVFRRWVEAGTPA